MAISHFSSSLFLSEAFVLFLMPSFSFSFFVLNIFGGQKRSHLFLHSLKTDMCFAFLFNSHLGYKKATYVKAGGRKARWAPGLDAAMSAWILPTSPFSPQDRRQGGSRALTKSGSRHCRADTAYSPQLHRKACSFIIKGTNIPSMLLFSTHYQRITSQCLKEVSFPHCHLFLNKVDNTYF